ncbi:guanylate cyclase domain-containing protein, partial [Haematococcus lacustris]
RDFDLPPSAIKVLAPGALEETTLLVTDIESSTTLWEVLPSHVMDETLREHHACIRQVLLKHNGYESATEGDSFLLAFHCPEDALLFALECQAAVP